MHSIYLDYNATTPIAPEVAAAMRPYLDAEFGNPSSSHWAGKRMRAAIDEARRQVAHLIRASAEEMVFTSGGTEANNWALKGVFFRTRGETSPHYIISAVEHPSVAETADYLARLGARVTRAPVDRFGRVDPDDIRSAITDATRLISVMHAQNEVGTLQPIREIAAIARERGVLLHTDAAQSAGKIPIDVNEMGVDLLTIAGHKMYAPAGIGALFIRRGVNLEKFMHGAGHEGGRRAGTENVVEIVALGAASELAEEWLAKSKVAELRDYFWRHLQNAFGERVTLNSHPTERLPNTLNVSFVGQQGHEILARLPSVAASTGSACHSGSHAMSPVLKAMGATEAAGLGAIRFSLGRGTTREEIDRVVELLISAGY